MIQIAELGKNEFEVTVSLQKITTHIVFLNDKMHQQLCHNRLSKTDLIIKSFEFLLQKEPNTSILSRFNLDHIGHYFPEYLNTFN